MALSPIGRVKLVVTGARGGLTAEATATLSSNVADAKNARDAAVVARGGAEAARLSAEVARDTSRGWAEGPVPAGGERSSKGWAQVAQANAAVSDTARAAVEMAISQVPTDTRLPIEASALSVLRSVAADTPVGRLAFLSESGREGVWQLRAGDYSAQIAADTFGTRYVAINGVSATQKAWVRIVPDNIWRFSWTGLATDTADARDYLRAGAALFPTNSTWLLPAHDIRLPANLNPTLMLKAGVRLTGAGSATHIDFTGTFNGNSGDPFFGIIQAPDSGFIIEKLRISGIAQGQSANNPGIIAVHKNGFGTDELRGGIVREIEFDRTTTGIYVLHHQAVADKQPNQAVVRPTGIEIHDIVGRSNGAAVSLFGADDTEVRDYDFRYDAALPSQPTAGHYAFRVLGTTESHIGRGKIKDHPVGVRLDAAYAFYGLRAVNKNVSIGAIEMTNVDYPFAVTECDGELRVTAPVARRSPASTNQVDFMTVAANLPLSAMDPDDPDPRKRSIVGDVIVEDADVAGYNGGVFAQGRMGHLAVRRNRMVGNGNVSDAFGVRYSVRTDSGGDPTGYPSTIDVTDNDFLMTSAAMSPLIQLVSRGGAVRCERNMLPEAEPLGMLPLGGGPVYTGGPEQRTRNLGANPGTNKSYRPGSFANWRDGTAIPAPVINAAAWTRNLVNVAEGPTNTFTKNAGESPSGDAALYATERYVGDFELIYRLPIIPANRLFVGLIADYYGTSFRKIFQLIDYSPDGSSVYSLANDSQLFGVGSYDTSTIERWSRVANRLTFSRDGVVLVNVAISAELGLRLQASISTTGDKVEILRFAPL